MLLLGALEVGDDALRDRIECCENIAPGLGIGLEAEVRHGAVVHEEFEVFHGGDVGQVALVVLKHEREAFKAAAIEPEIGFERLEGVDVLPLAIHLAVGDEDDTVGLTQHELEGGVVGDLTGDGVEVEAGLVARKGAAFHREEIEEESAILGGGEANKITAALGIELGVDLAQVRGLPAQRCAAVNDLEADGPCLGINGWHLRNHAGKLASDQGNLVPQPERGLCIVQNAEDGTFGETKGHEAITGVHGEGLRAINADERGERA